MIYLEWNKEYQKQQRFITNWYGTQAQAALTQDNTENSYINKELDGGKWNGYGSEYHIGQTTWEPRTSQFSFSGDFAIVSVSNTAGTEMVVVPQYAQGSSAGKKTGFAQLPNIHSWTKETRYVHVANTKNGSFSFTATPSSSWILVNQTSGNVTSTTQMCVGISIDWNNIPSGSSSQITGTVNITGAGATVTVNVTGEILNTTSVVLPEKTFVETDGYVSILSKNYAKSVKASDGSGWEVLPGYGREESAVKVVPTQLNGSRTPGSNSPYVEYNVYIRTPGQIDVVTQWAPTNGPEFQRATRVRYGVSFNNDTIKTVHTLPPDFRILSESNDITSWGSGVENAVHTATVRDGDVCHSTHTVSAPGVYSLRIYQVDDGLVLYKILVGTNTLERASTNSRTVSINVNPDTRELTSTNVSVTIPAVSLPRIFIGSQAGTGGSYDTYLGPPETYHTTA